MIVNKPRFPRLSKDGSDDIVLRFRRLRREYPPPEYDRQIHGSWNPGDYIPTWLMKQDRKKLKHLCKQHSLDRHGSRWELVKRMYLHWRAAKLKIAGNHSEYYGYGKGYENVKIPVCSCGSVEKRDMEMREKKREEAKILAKEQLARFLAPIQRFPRYPRHPREHA